MAKMVSLDIWLVLAVFAVLGPAVHCSECPDKMTLSCVDDGVPCPSMQQPKRMYFRLDDGTECHACQICLPTFPVCPNVPCWIREFPENCKTVSTYSTYVKTLDGPCPMCDVLSCLNPTTHD